MLESKGACSLVGTPYPTNSFNSVPIRLQGQLRFNDGEKQIFPLAARCSMTADDR